MLGVIDVIFLVFAFITLYFMVFFMLVYFTRDKGIPKNNFTGSVSFIIPAFNEEESISETITAIKETEYVGEKEIIVVDDGSTDNTAALARKTGATVYSTKNRGKAKALNFALTKTKGNFIVSVDADSFLTKDSLKEAMKYFADDKVGAVTVSILSKEKKGLLSRLQELEYIMIAWARKNLEHVESVFVTPGPMSIYRKSVLTEMKGFDEDNLTEDIEMAWRVLKGGHKIRMATSAVVYTTVPTKFKEWWRQRSRWNMGGLQTLWKHKSSIFANPGSFSMFVIPFFTFSLIISLSGLTVFSYLIAKWILGTSAYVIGTAQVGISPFTSTSFLDLPILFVIFGAIILTLSIIYSKMNFSFYSRKFQEKKDYLVMLFYLALYISIFPILLVYSIVKLLAGKKEW
jgi:cellulose synthase/poly-beta-1,6-N-acetylglucosamine synthase-like glycosyltransferase